MMRPSHAKCSLKQLYRPSNPVYKASNTDTENERFPALIRLFEGGHDSCAKKPGYFPVFRVLQKFSLSAGRKRLSSEKNFATTLATVAQTSAYGICACSTCFCMAYVPQASVPEALPENDTLTKHPLKQHKRRTHYKQHITPETEPLYPGNRTTLEILHRLLAAWLKGTTHCQKKTIHLIQADL